MNIFKLLIAFILLAGVVFRSAVAQDLPVGISSNLMSIEVMHDGKTVEIIRNQDNLNSVTPDFALTSRPCPPFCIQPMVLAEGVETLGELEVITYLQEIQQGDESIIVMDSRTPDWVQRGTIPGSRNISWVELAPSQGATTEGITALMTERFGVRVADGVDEIDIDEAIVEGTLAEIFDYSAAKTLVLFCNGMWCGQSPVSIRTLLRYGYPAEKLKWYRGGMQAWQILGLTTVTP